MILRMFDKKSMVRERERERARVRPQMPYKVKKDNERQTKSSECLYLKLQDPT